MSKVDAARAYVRKQQGVFLASQARKDGIESWTLSYLKRKKMVRTFARGIYYPANLDFREPDLVSRALKFPNGIACFVDALFFHSLTLEFPRGWLAVPKGERKKKIAWPHVIFLGYPKELLDIGIEEHSIDGVGVKIFGPERAVVDSYYLQNKFGPEIAHEALELYMDRESSGEGPILVDKLLVYARICGVCELITNQLDKMYDRLVEAQQNKTKLGSFLAYDGLMKHWGKNNGKRIIRS